MEILVSVDPNCPDDKVSLWDTVWNPASGSGDWALAGPRDPANPMGLAANAVLETAVILSLFTDRQCPADHPLAKWAGSDRRGYWGDYFLEEGETPMGSLLWLLERAAMLPGIDKWAEAFALDALAPLITQGAVAATTAKASALPGGKGITLAIGLYAQSGQQIYAREFDVLWRQLGAPPIPPPPDLTAALVAANGSALATQSGVPLIAD